MIIYKLIIFDPEDPDTSNIEEYFIKKELIKHYFKNEKIDNLNLIENEDYEINKIIVREN